MATKVTATLLDDLDGQPAGETLGVGLDGTVYEIDLSAANAKAFRAGFGPYVENGRKVTGKPPKGRTAPDKITRASIARAVLNKRARDWARSVNYEKWNPDSKGRIPGFVLQEFDVASAAALNVHGH